MVTTVNEFASPATAMQKQNSQSFTLNVTAPLDGQKVTTSSIVVTGQTVANADVFVNEIDAKADQNGTFSVSYPLEEGANYLVVGANDDNGNYNEQQLTVYQE
jgi:hypothetical protein